METNNNAQPNLDIFNLSNESLVNPPKKKSNELYSPSADKGKEGVYKALIRFLPNVRNADKSKLMKYYVWLKDPVTKQNYSMDCPSTVGKRSILKDTYWKLKNSTSARDQEMAQEEFGRAESYYSFVQVVKDPQEPELEGKIMIFKFGSKINQKIEKLLKPEFGAPVNPYDVFDGKLFALHITKKQKWNNYDLCEFVGEKMPLEIEKGVPLQKNKEDMAKVVEWLKAGSTELEKYEYKEWTEADHDKVVQTIKNIVPDQRMVEQLLGAADGASSTGGFQAGPPKKKSEDFFEAAPAKTAKAEHKHEEAHAEEAPKKAAGKVSSIDDLYDNL